MAHTFVKDVMKTDVVILDESVSIQDAASKMIEKKIGCVIISKQGKHVGILTEKDFITIAAEGRPLFTTISEVMSSPLIGINSEETIWEAAELMKEKNIHKIPVIDNDKVVGIVTATDLVNQLAVSTDKDIQMMFHESVIKVYRDYSPYN